MTRRSDPFLTSVLAITMLLAGSEARAEERHGSSESPAAISTTRSWYGWQTLIGDGAVLLLAGGGDGDDDIRDAVALGLYGTVSPVIHLWHGSVPKALGSVGMRSIPVVTYVGIQAALKEPNEHPDSELGRELLGGLVAVLLYGGVVGIDAGVLAWEAREAREARSRREDTGFRIVPQVSMDSTSGHAGIAGVF